MMQNSNLNDRNPLPFNRSIRPKPVRSILRKSTRSLDCSQSASNFREAKRSTFRRSVSFSGDRQSRWQDSADSLESIPDKSALGLRMPIRRADKEAAPRMPIRRAGEGEDNKKNCVYEKRAVVIKSRSLGAVFQIPASTRRQVRINSRGMALSA